MIREILTVVVDFGFQKVGHAVDVDDVSARYLTESSLGVTLEMSRFLKKFKFLIKNLNSWEIFVPN